MDRVRQALARRWRPQSFADFVGQDTVVKALRHALDSGRLHHAFLFTGTRGVGKTTLARLLAKCLNCEGGVSSTPCGQCSACLGIAQGSFVDLLEVDAASRTRVDETRELLDNVPYAPSQGRYKVYLIDEVHMLSTHSFNALLKTLEEPPEHVKFLLATTDPQKVPATILSRCLQFQLRRLEPELIARRLGTILAAEKISFGEDALRLLAEAADGSLRDALSLTDQAIALGAGTVDAQTVTAMLGLCPNDLIDALLAAMLDRDSQRLFALVAEQSALGRDPASLLDGIIEGLHRLNLGLWLPELGKALPEHLLDRARQLAPMELQAWYHLLLSARRDFSLYPNPRMALEMALLRLLSFALPEGPKTDPKNRQSPGPEDSTPPMGAKPMVLAEQDKGTPAAQQIPDYPHEDAQASWRGILARLSIEPSLREFLVHSRALRCEQTELVLAIDPVYLDLVRRQEQKLQMALGKEVRLHLVRLEKEHGSTLSQANQEAASARRAALEAEALADPRLQEFQEVLQARLLQWEMQDLAVND